MEMCAEIHLAIKIIRLVFLYNNQQHW